MAVQKGQKRGSYKRSQQKRELQENTTPEDGMSYLEIANILGISVAEVKKIEKSALSKLKSPSAKNQQLHRYHKINLRPSERIDV